MLYTQLNVDNYGWPPSTILNCCMHLLIFHPRGDRKVVGGWSISKYTVLKSIEGVMSHQNHNQQLAVSGQYVANILPSLWALYSRAIPWSIQSPSKSSPSLLWQTSNRYIHNARQYSVEHCVGELWRQGSLSLSIFYLFCY